jgi:hypothetical protein
MGQDCLLHLIISLMNIFPRFCSHIQSSRCCLLQVNIISLLKPPNLKLITTSMYNDITQCILMLGNCQIFYKPNIRCWNKVARYSHAWIHTLGSSMLIIAIASCQIKVSNSSSWPCNQKGGVHRTHSTSTVADEPCRLDSTDLFYSHRIPIPLA